VPAFAVPGMMLVLARASRDLAPKLKAVNAGAHSRFGPQVVRRSATLPSKTGPFSSGYSKPTFVQLSNVRNEGDANEHGFHCANAASPHGQRKSTSARRIED
jgi:hypothetical protein